MFGGHGLYAGEVFFAIVRGCRVYFRVGDESRPAYEASGSGPFSPPGRSPIRSYYEVPEDVLASAPLLREWAEAASRSRR